MIGIGTAAGVIVFALRNCIRKRYRLFSVIYTVVSALVLYVFAQMLYSLANGFVCARDPAVTLAIYLVIEVLLLLFLSDTVSAGKKRRDTVKKTD